MRSNRSVTAKPVMSGNGNRLSLLTGAIALIVFTTAAQAQYGDVNERNADGSTPLQWAVYEGDADAVRQLLEAGADVGLANNYDVTAMSLAAEVADTQTLRMLLDAGADVESPNADGAPAMSKRPDCCSSAVLVSMPAKPGVGRLPSCGPRPGATRK